jgi:hypothetical protein
MIISFELSMPNVGSWNGRWSGESKRYIIRKTIRSQKDIEKVQSLIGYHYYNFGDGWGAGITVTEIDSSESRKLDKYKKNGFCGYEWMVKSLWNYGKILNDSQVESLNNEN